jgi:FkbM family methyltransferase
MNDFQNHFKNLYSEQGKPLSILQIGGNDGIQADPLYNLIQKYPNVTLNVLEPIKRYYDNLKSNYKSNYNVKTHNLAIAEYNGTNEITYVNYNSSMPSWAKGLGTFNIEGNCLSGMTGLGNTINCKSENWWKLLNENKVKETVKVKKLNTFLEDINLKEIDIYVSDTEGYDWIIFEQLDLDKYFPKLIYMETHGRIIPKDLLSKKLDKYNYKYYHGHDTVAYKY